jgi:hypothetical protein
VAARWHARPEKPVCNKCLHPAVPVYGMTSMQNWWLEKSGLSLEELLEIGRDLGWC